MWSFPIIHTNIWDVFTAVPVVMVFTQLIKIIFNIPKSLIPYIALMAGLLLSILIAHPHHLLGAIFMGWFYGYAAIGSYSSLKTGIIYYRKK